MNTFPRPYTQSSLLDGRKTERVGRSADGKRMGEGEPFRDCGNATQTSTLPVSEGGVIAAHPAPGTEAGELPTRVGKDRTEHPLVAMDGSTRNPRLVTDRKAEVASVGHFLTDRATQVASSDAVVSTWEGAHNLRSRSTFSTN